jgi:hypothetical protein
MEPNHVIVYRSQFEYEQDQFWRQNPELAFWLFVGIVGGIFLLMLYSWGCSMYRKHKTNKFLSVGLHNKRR